MSGAWDSSDFGGNSISVGSDDNGYNNYAFISGFELINFRTEGEITNFISLMSNNMILTTIFVGEKYTFFISDN